jgi:hypothetical protein
MKSRQRPANQNAINRPLNGMIHIHHRNTVINKICHLWSCSSYNVLGVPAWVKLSMHSITSNFCSTTYVMQLVTSVQSWLNMPLSCKYLKQCSLTLMVEGFRAHTHTHMCLPPYISVHVILSDSQTEVAIVWEVICKRIALFFYCISVWSGID